VTESLYKSEKSRVHSVSECSKSVERATAVHSLSGVQQFKLLSSSVI